MSILPKQIKKQRRLIVIWNFEVEYASGRRESLRRESNSKAKELRDDLSRAIEIGSVLSFKEYIYDNKNDLKSGKKRGSTVHLRPETKDVISRKALEDGISFSRYMRNLAEKDAAVV